MNRIGEESLLTLSNSFYLLPCPSYYKAPSVAPFRTLPLPKDSQFNSLICSTSSSRATRSFSRLWLSVHLSFLLSSRTSSVTMYPQQSFYPKTGCLFSFRARKKASLVCIEGLGRLIVLQKKKKKRNSLEWD